jgi:hypothetical protein
MTPSEQKPNDLRVVVVGDTIEIFLVDGLDHVPYRNLYSFYSDIRKRLMEETQTMGWNIRYAAMIKSENFAFLHSPSLLKVVIDSWGPYRCPMRELQKEGKVVFSYAPSKPYYFKPLSEASIHMDKFRVDSALNSQARSQDSI